MLSIIDKKIKLPPNCVLYVDPNLNPSGKVLKNYASISGINIGSDPHLDLNIIDAEVTASYGFIRSFNGSSDHFYCDNHSGIDVTTATPEKPLSVFSIIKPLSPVGNQWIICKNDSLASDTQYGLYYDETKQFLTFLNGANRAGTGANSITSGNWYFAGFMWDGTNIYMYINNKLMSATPYSGILTSRPNFRIGCRGNNAIFFYGLVGVQLITRCHANDIIAWAKKVKLLRRYGMAS